MGSELRLSAWTTDETAARAAFEEVFKEFDRLEGLMSVWRKGSDVLRLNAAAGGDPVAVSPEVLEVLGLARQVSEWTDGKFDVSFGALSGLWKFDHDKDNRVPHADEIQARLPLVAYEDIELNERAGTARLARPGMSVHFGGIGKGYAVDRGAELLRRRGIADFLIQAGGDLYVAGQPEGRPWRLGIQDPRGPANQSFAIIELTNATFSTSGDYSRFFFHEGRRYHHLLDPDRGEPATGSRSVTIVTNRAVLADALSTGVFIVGPRKGMALIERLPDVEGIIVSAENHVLVSSGLARHVTWRTPTDAP
jgi:thiamine biosynthesis lipoprotein